MLFLKTRGSVLGLAVALLWPAAAFAQTPDVRPEAAPPRVQLKVDFVTVSAAALDKSGATFDRVPFAPPAGKPAQAETFLRYAAGGDATRLFQTLARMGSKSIGTPLITTDNNVRATIQIETRAPGPQKKFLTLQTGLVITPRINTDDSITLNVSPQIAGVNGLPVEPQGTTLRTIRSGDMMAVDGLPFGSDKADSTERLLVFIQPTLTGANTQRGDAGRSAPPLLPLPNAAPLLRTTISMDVFNADLPAVIALLERQSHMKASLLGVRSAYKRVDVHISGATLPEALGAIARSAGAQIIRGEDGVYVFSPVTGGARAPM